MALTNGLSALRAVFGDHVKNGFKLISVRSFRTNSNEVEYLPYERKKFVRRFGMVQRHHSHGEK